jgi:hypothetical protein
MGVPPEWRKLLYNMIAKRGGCFFEKLPATRAEAPFDVVILDAMQVLALVKRGDNYQTGPAVATLVKDVLYGHLVPTDALGRDVVAGRLLVACFDNAHAVPRNKAFTEATRDDTDTLIRSPAEFDALVAHACNLRVEEEKRTLTIRAPETTPAGVRMCEDRVRSGYHACSRFLVTRQGDFPTGGGRVWRNACLSWQLKRLVTEAVLEMQVPEGKTLLLDDGIVLTEKQYEHLAASMIKDHGYGSSPYSELARASLVGQLMSSCVERVLLLPGRKYRKLARTGLGEADHKVLYYVQRTLPLGLPCQPGKKASYLVKSQDTDVLWALLAHVGAALENPATGQVDEVEVWLDSQTPADRSNNLSRPYRFVNIVACWRALHSVLAIEFPTLKNPFESFLALVFCSANDYVEAFAGPLKLGPGTIWNTWAQALCRSSGHTEYPSFSVEGKREKVSPSFPLALKGLVDDWVAVRQPPYGVPCATHIISLRHKEAERFFYALVQRSPLLSGCARRFKEKSGWAKQGAPFESQSAPLLEVLTELATLCVGEGDQDVPPLLGVPTAAAMRARIARVNWTLDYYLNGWKTHAFGHNWFAMHGEYSRHGWTAEDITETADDPGSGVALCSQYLFAEYCPPRRGANGDSVLPRYRLRDPRLAFEVGPLAF